MGLVDRGGLSNFIPVIYANIDLAFTTLIDFILVDPIKSLHLFLLKRWFMSTAGMLAGVCLFHKLLLDGEHL